MFAHKLILIVKVPKRSFFISRENRQTRKSQHGTIFLKNLGLSFPPLTSRPSLFLAVFHCLLVLLSHAYHQMVYELTAYLSGCVFNSIWMSYSGQETSICAGDRQSEYRYFHAVIAFCVAVLWLGVIFLISHHVASQPSVLSLHTVLGRLPPKWMIPASGKILVYI